MPAAPPPSGDADPGSPPTRAPTGDPTTAPAAALDREEEMARLLAAERAAHQERARLLASLEVERSRLASVFAQAPSVLAIVRGPQYVLDMANDAYLAVNGYRDVLGKPLLDAVPELRGQGFEQLLDHVVATGEPYVGREIPIWLSTAPGAPPEERFFDFVYLPLVEPDASGAPTRVGVIAHGNDITEQVRARREVERARERADRLQLLTAALAATTTPEAVAEVVVAQAVEATGAATGMLVLRDSAHAGGTGGVDEAAAECVRTGEALFVGSGDAVRARFPHLVHVWDAMGTEAVAAVPLAVAGETVGAMAFTWTAPRELPLEVREFFLTLGAQAAQALERARLLAAERVARAEAEAARAAAEAGIRAKAEFLTTMSHELRTPLNAIQGHVQLLDFAIHGPITDAQRDALARIDRAQRHLLGMINDILNFARLESGRLHYDIAALPLRDVVAGVLPMVEPQAATAGLTLAVELPDDAPPLHVLADRDKLTQVLLNLIGNAIKFTRPGGRVTVALAAAADAAPVRLQVRDTGIGIPADELEEIFQPFVQVRAPDRSRGAASGSEGVGLGLAISRDLARAMGGDITVESTLGAGSTFTLTLPRG